MAVGRATALPTITGYAKAGAVETALGYTGEQVDGNGFVYLRARYYAPGMGRFTQMDPSRQERNAYLYAAGNPTRYVDPTGLSFELRLSTCPSLQQGEGCCGLRIDKWFLRELKIHSNWVDSTAQSISSSVALLPWQIRSGYIPSMILTTFRDYAKAIPYKWMNFQVLNHPSDCPSSNCERSVTLCDKCIDRSELGNIMFGMSGTRFNIPKPILFGAAKSPFVGALRGESEQSAATVGVKLARKIDGITSSKSLCDFMQGLPEWESVDQGLVTVEGEYLSPSTCTVCDDFLPPWYGHTVPAVAGKPAGQSDYADDPTDNKLDPFYTIQLPGQGDLRYLAPELCDSVTDSTSAGSGTCGSLPDQKPPR